MAVGLSGYRTFYLTVRIRDEATRGAQSVNRAIGSMGEEADRTNQRMLDIGRGMASAGTFFAGVGATGVGALASMTKGALDFSQQIAYAFTQVDEVGASMDQVEDIAKRVADRVPVPLEQLAEGLYDIYSSIDISVVDSEIALERFAKAAIAGQTDVRTAARSTVAVMNAFNLSTKDTGDIMDWQFQLVRKGVGTYEDFAGTIGLALPAFRAADQELETLGGSLTFLTRQGLSTSRAATSAARAMELLATPKAVKNLREAGIEVTNADGTFRQMNDIVTELAAGPFKDLTGPKFREMFKEIFGTGRIQARRFFDIALKNSAEYNQRVGEFIDMQGAMEKAYDIMYNEPIMRSQELAVQFDLLKQEVGNRLIPAFETLVGWAQTLIDRWDALDPKTKDMAVKIAAITSVATLAGGALLFFSGMALLATVTMKGFIATISWAAIGKMIAMFGPWVLLLIAVGVAVYYIWKYWDKIWPVIAIVRDAIVDFAKACWTYLKPVIDKIFNVMVAIWEKLAPIIEGVWKVIKKVAKVAWKAISDVVLAAAREIKDKLSRIWKVIRDNFGDLWKQLGIIFEDFFGKIQGIVRQFTDFFSTAWTMYWDATGDAWKGLWENILAVFGVVLAGIKILWNNFTIIFKPLWVAFWNILTNTVTFVIDGWKSILSSAFDVIRVAFEQLVQVIVAVWEAAWTVLESAIEIFLSAIILILAVFTGDWKQAWEEIKDIGGAIWNAFAGIVGAGWEIINGILNIMLEAFKGIGTTLFDLFVGAGRWLWGVGQEVVRGFVGGFMSILTGAVGGAGGMAFIDRVQSAIFSAFMRADEWLWDVGRSMMTGLWNGFKEVWQGFKEWLATVLGPLARFIPGLPDMGALPPAISPERKAELEDQARQEHEYAERLRKQQAATEAARKSAEQAGVQPESLYSPDAMYMFQHGGVVTRPTAGVVGEAGPEAVIPLSQLGQFMGGGAEGGGIIVNVYGNAGEDDVTFARRVALAVGEEVFANGY